ncbi:hypothetical protein [Edaphobacter modestus]|uniref:Low-complexity protein n=1 Tax=Edaphobacter modestus TaxID=388466 RepID=A0A4Q7YYJ8_9BACT|nr:hypothetical protein [Edaphobacter modestus]RZU42957.1 hypothetical protein BDD14_4558 [Edaphobacter modestus]
MKNSFKAMMLSAAVTGLLSGSTTPLHASSSHDGAQLGQAALVSSSMMAQDTDKHSCKGKNDCKGKGGCKAGDNGCKGKNSCKGKGGCATDGSKH